MLSDHIINFFFSWNSHERKELIPLSLFLVSQWERRLLMKECTLQEHVLLGGPLCMLWGGLSFADRQRLLLHSLSWCITALRDSCYRTNTSTTRQFWAIQAGGFLSPGEWSWVAQWLVSLDTLWSQAHQTMSDADFLLPMTRDDYLAYPLVPLPYLQALHWSRGFCTLPWKLSVIPASANSGDCTSHSLMTTIQGWFHQLAQQGFGYRRKRAFTRAPSQRKYEALQPIQESAVLLATFRKVSQLLRTSQCRIRPAPMIGTRRTLVRALLHLSSPQLCNSLTLERLMYS